MPRIPRKPQIVNRGPAGLLHKLPGNHAQVPEQQIPQGKRNNIAPGLKGLMVDVSTLKFDPDNAKLHPERNMQAIKDSINLYGQVKPVVVRKENNTVVAGNGTLQAVKELGWTKIAAVFVSLTDAEAAGYGMADNRTSELGKWNLEALKRMEQLVTSGGGKMVGWTMDELLVIRTSEWEPPEEDDDEGTWVPGVNSVIQLTPEHREMIDKAIKVFKERRGNEAHTEAMCLYVICQEWLTQQPEYSELPDADDSRSSEPTGSYSDEQLLGDDSPETW